MARDRPDLLYRICLRRSAQSRPASDEGLGVMIEVDGAHGEGGGQLLRMAVALSALTDTPVRVVRIRAGRPTPGLAAQHVTAIDAVAKLCGGEGAGLAGGSSTNEFRPGTLAAAPFPFDVGPAGGVTHILQAVLPGASA